MLLEHVEKVKFCCFQKEDWFMELVLQRVQKGRWFFQETGVIIMTEMFITVCPQGHLHGEEFVSCM
jgi:hypothetical protein